MKPSVQLIWVKAIRKQWAPNRKERPGKTCHAMSFQAFFCSRIGKNKLYSWHEVLLFHKVT